MEVRFLPLTWATSRGRDTYGYNVCRLDDSTTDTRFRCSGGGYDLIGTVFGNWLESVHQESLLTLRDRFDSWSRETGFVRQENNPARLYGATYYPAKNRVSLDGACGVESMRAIAEAIGVSVTRSYNRRGHTNGFFVSWGA
jgi:hypothetical protein